MKKLIVLGLLLALAGASSRQALAEDTTPAPPTPETPAPAPAPAAKATKPVEQQLNGRVVAVDKEAKTITLQVNNQSYVLSIADTTKFAKAGKEKGFDDLLVGDEVSVTVSLRESAGGRVEIFVVSVDLPKTTDAQGGGSSTPGAKIPPFVSLPNPANVGGQVRSPSR